jgi:hypothetical protein
MLSFFLPILSLPFDFAQGCFNFAQGDSTPIKYATLISIMMKSNRRLKTIN